MTILGPGDLKERLDGADHLGLNHPPILAVRPLGSNVASPGLSFLLFKLLRGAVSKASMCYCRRGTSHSASDSALRQHASVL